VPAESWGTFVGYCVPQLLAVCVLYTEITISAFLNKWCVYYKIKSCALIGTPYTNAIIILHKCRPKYAQHPSTWSCLLADLCLQPVAVYVYISIPSIYWGCFFLNKYNFILTLASTVFKEYFVNTIEDTGCWFGSIDTIVNTCNKTYW
jgi:hypothetical protein